MKKIYEILMNGNIGEVIFTVLAIAFIIRVIISILTED